MTAAQKTYIPRKGQDAEFSNVDVTGAFSVNGTDIAATPAEMNKLDGIPAAGYLVVVAEVTFTETTGAGTYTGSVTVPAGSTILDIQVRSTALWTATTTALMDVGDAADPNGWYAAIDLKATDLLVGEVIRFESTGGKEGAYLVTATGKLEKSYNAAAVVISGIVVTVGAAGNAGRTRMIVVYATPTATAATKA